MRAYALMRHPNDLEAAYLASPFVQANRDRLVAFRRLLAFDRFASYRGIGRCPFSEEYPDPEPGWEGQAGPLDTAPDARQLLRSFLGPDDHLTPGPRAFLRHLEQARQLQAALKRPAQFEIVDLCRSPDVPRDLLGFDVGYWGGGNYSILCDTAVWPRWHPPSDEVLPELSKFVAGLNSHALFETRSGAQDYLVWYGRQDWAEKPTEDFSIVGVGAVNESGRAG
jgi:hypothetical protein